MKKARILALVLVVALMMTGVAYALWNQSITMTTHAEMGKMDVAVTCGPSVYPLSYMPGLPGHIIDGFVEDYMNPMKGEVNWNGQVMTVTVGDMYPGAKYGVNFSIKNTGDVPFSLESAKISYTGGSWDLFARMKGSLTFQLKSNIGTVKTFSVSEAALNEGGLEAAILKAFNDNNIILYPGDELLPFGISLDGLATTMQVSVDKTIKGDEFEETGTSFNVVFNWQQCDPIQF